MVAPLITRLRNPEPAPGIQFSDDQRKMLEDRGLGFLATLLADKKKPGATDPSLQGIERVTKGQIDELTSYDSGDIVEEFIGRQRQPGGYLASGVAQQEFALGSSGLLQALRRERSQLDTDFRGLNPLFARRGRSTLDFDALSQLLNLRTGAQLSSSQRNYEAGQGLANTRAAEDVAEKQSRLGAYQYSEDLLTQLKVGKSAASATKSAGATSAIGSIIGGLI